VHNAKCEERHNTAKMLGVKLCHSKTEQREAVSEITAGAELSWRSLPLRVNCISCEVHRLSKLFGVVAPLSRMSQTSPSKKENVSFKGILKKFQLPHSRNLQILTNIGSFKRMLLNSSPS
jgi:hypothetical protein